MAGPILPSTVHRILAHISPLEDALPPCLISKPLLKRHHFLGLTLNDAAEYLAWPSSSDPSQILQLLVERPLQDLGDNLNAHYTADSEEFLAHVCISSDLRLVFLWEEENGWQYHNLAMMPFPPDSAEDFNDAYSLYSKNDFLSESVYEVTVSGGDDDDSYWNSYGQQDDSSHHLSAPKAHEDINSEDAYWARYSTIQGSADSTVPSPIPPVKNIRSEFNNSEQLESQERIIVPSAEFQIHHAEPYNPFEPPSPGGISRRLQALSDTLPSPLIDEPASGSEMLSPHDTDADTSPTTVESPIPADDHDAAVQMVLQDTIKNVYRLWRISRQDKSAEQDKQIFVDAVQCALQDL